MHRLAQDLRAARGRISRIVVSACQFGYNDRNCVRRLHRKVRRLFALPPATASGATLADLVLSDDWGTRQWARSLVPCAAGWHVQPVLVTFLIEIAMRPAPAAPSNRRSAWAGWLWQAASGISLPSKPESRPWKIRCRATTARLKRHRRGVHGPTPGPWSCCLRW